MREKQGKKKLKKKLSNDTTTLTIQLPGRLKPSQPGDSPSECWTQSQSRNRLNSERAPDCSVEKTSIRFSIHQPTTKSIYYPQESCPKYQFGSIYLLPNLQICLNLSCPTSMTVPLSPCCSTFPWCRPDRY